MGTINISSDSTVGEIQGNVIINKVESCPFCGSDAIVVPQSHIDNHHHDLNWAVICQNELSECNARILYCISELEAIEQWNRRYSIKE